MLLTVYCIRTLVQARRDVIHWQDLASAHVPLAGLSQHTSLEHFVPAIVSTLTFSTARDLDGVQGHTLPEFSGLDTPNILASGANICRESVPHLDCP